MTLLNLAELTRAETDLSGAAGDLRDIDEEIQLLRRLLKRAEYERRNIEDRIDDALDRLRAMSEDYVDAMGYER